MSCVRLHLFLQYPTRPPPPPTASHSCTFPHRPLTPGRSLSAGKTVLVNPDLPAAVQLLGWFNAEGKDQTGRKLSVRSGGAGSDTRIILSAIKVSSLP